MNAGRYEPVMEQCLRLAGKGRGAVSPNPMVGAVILRRGKIVGSGFHKKFGGAHAEVNAIRSVRGPLKGATMVVNLEPCCHQGKTPPCTDAIVSSGITHVVIGMKDPNPLVAGRGIRALRKAGIRVTTGISENACRELNAGFVKYITTGLPLVTLKIAQSADGAIADHAGNAWWITGRAARTDGHRQRATSDAVLVGSGTIAKDDPRLTVRHVRGKQPVRIVLDGKLSVDPGARIFTGARSRPVVVVTTEKAFITHRRRVSTLGRKGVTFMIFRGGRNGHIPVQELLSALGRRGVLSLLVEGGPQTWGEFLNAKSADKLLAYTAPLLLGGHRKSFSTLKPLELTRGIKLKNCRYSDLGADHLLSADLSYSPRIG